MGIWKIKKFFILLRNVSGFWLHLWMLLIHFIYFFVFLISLERQILRLHSRVIFVVFLHFFLLFLSYISSLHHIFYILCLAQALLTLKFLSLIETFNLFLFQNVNKINNHWLHISFWCLFEELLELSQPLENFFHVIFLW